MTRVTPLQLFYSVLGLNLSRFARIEKLKETMLNYKNDSKLERRKKKEKEKIPNEALWLRLSSSMIRYFDWVATYGDDFFFNEGEIKIATFTVR